MERRVSEIPAHIVMLVTSTFELYTTLTGTRSVSTARARAKPDTRGNGGTTDYIGISTREAKVLDEL